MTRCHTTPSKKRWRARKTKEFTVLGASFSRRSRRISPLVVFRRA